MKLPSPGLTECLEVGWHLYCKRPEGLLSIYWLAPPRGRHGLPAPDPARNRRRSIVPLAGDMTT
jgi:hypothetical protein